MKQEISGGIIGTSQTEVQKELKDVKESNTPQTKLTVHTCQENRHSHGKFVLQGRSPSSPMWKKVQGPPASNKELVSCCHRRKRIVCLLLQRFKETTGRRRKMSCAPSHLIMLRANRKRWRRGMCCMKLHSKLLREGFRSQFCTNRSAIQKQQYGRSPHASSKVRRQST